MEKPKSTDSKKINVVRMRENMTPDPVKKAQYPYQLKAKFETVDKDGDVSIEHRYLASKVKIEKPGEYEFYVVQGSMVDRTTKELITWLKIEELRK